MRRRAHHDAAPHAIAPRCFTLVNRHLMHGGLFAMAILRLFHLFTFQYIRLAQINAI